MKLSPHIDPILSKLIDNEIDRLEEQITLIASENYASPAVMAATGSVLTNKYAEGYPGKRYYAGCTWVDAVENLAIDRCKQLFGASHANVQPHAGSQANAAVYFATLKPGDTILGMSLSEGGHLTHGHKVNFSGSIYNSVQYHVNKDTELLDYDEIERLAQLHRPKIIVAGASAYSRTIDFARFATIAHSVGALFMADIAHIAGLVATGHHPSPIGHADFITSTTHKTLRGPRGGLIMMTAEHAQTIDRAIMPGTQGGPFLNSIAAKAAAFHEALQPEFAEYQKQVVGNAQVFAKAMTDLGYRIVAGGTDNHLFIVDLRAKNITGHEAALALEKAGIIVSKSGIPFDPQKPWITSGIRIGTPAVTTRGMKQGQMIELAEMIDEVIARKDNEAYLAGMAQQVKRMCAQFSVYAQEVQTQNHREWQTELGL
jgi:glycine hydroxymethyltransferase